MILMYVYVMAGSCFLQVVTICSAFGPTLEHYAIWPTHDIYSSSKSSFHQFPLASQIRLFVDEKMAYFMSSSIKFFLLFHHIS